MSGSGKWKKVGKKWVQLSKSLSKSTSSEANEKRVKIDEKWLKISKAKPYINKILKKILNHEKDSIEYLSHLSKLPTKSLQERVDELKTGFNNVEDFYKDFLFNSSLRDFYKQGSKKKHYKKKPTKKHKKGSTKRRSTKRRSVKRRSVKRIYTKRR